MLCPSKATKKVLTSWLDGSILLTQVPSGTPGNRSVSSSQSPPSSRLIQVRPSSVPAKRKPCWSGDSASATMVAKVSAPVTSRVIPPVVSVLTWIFSASA